MELCKSFVAKSQLNVVTLYVQVNLSIACRLPRLNKSKTAFPNPLEEKLNRIGLRFEDVSPIIHSFVDTICLGVVVREREIILDSPIDVTTATYGDGYWMVSNFH